MALDRIEIHGGHPLRGTVPIACAKNALLPLMAACLLTDQPVTLRSIPSLSDIITMSHLLMHHGVRLTLDGNGCTSTYTKNMRIHAKDITNDEAPYDIVRRMRASILVLGPLVTRTGKARVSMPGGCAIGVRPIQLHLDALQAMGADITLDEGYICIDTPKGRLQGAEITFPRISVGATENAIMAAVLAKGVTTLHNAALEPEIVDLCEFLITLGADITGHGTSTIRITGVEGLTGGTYKAIGDRIEAGTYAVAAMMTRGQLRLEGIAPGICDNIFAPLKAAGADITYHANAIDIAMDRRPSPITVETAPYPGFPTDMQAQYMALAAIANGTSMIHETVFENRLMHVPELMRMGARITLDHMKASVEGIESLAAAEVMATDLRASVSLVLAALTVPHKTILHRVYHIDRGYERIEDKLTACGADIKRTREA